jgi:hypothetical protein
MAICGRLRGVECSERGRLSAEEVRKFLMSIERYVARS